MAGLVGGRWGAAVAVVALVSTIVVTAATPTAASPIEPAPDPMPTWQTDGALVNGKNPSGRVWHIEYGHGTSAGMVFIAGRFDSVRAPAGGEGGTVQRSFVAALDVDTGYLIERFSPTITADEGDLEIRALELSGDGATLYIGGWFTMVNGEGRRHLAALDAITGAVHEWNPTPSGKVDVLMATADGSTLYAGGHFLEVDGTTRTHVAAFDMTAGGTLIGDFDPMIQQPGPRRCGPRCWPVVLAMTLSPDEQTLYVGGAFGIVDGEERNSAVALDTSDGTVLAWNPNIFHTRPDGTGSLNTIYELAATTERVYLCGDYWAINTDERGQYASPNVQAVDAVSGLADRDWVGSTDGAVNDCAIVGDTLIIGGHFDYAGGVKPADENGETRRHIAGLDLVTGDLTAWDPAANSTAGLYAVGRHVTDYLGVGGDFTTVNGGPQEGFAQFPIGVPGPGAVVFDEGFANGLGSWTKVKNLTTDPTSGGADPPSAAGTATMPAKAFAWYELPTPRRALCVSVEVRIDSVASSRSTLLKLRAADGRAIAEVFRRQNGKVKLRSIVSGERSGTTAVLETGVWYTVETCLTKGADPQWEIAVDGVQVAAWRPDVGNRKFGIVQIGDDRKRVWDGRFDDVLVRRR